MKLPIVDILHVSDLLQEDNCLEENWMISGSIFHMVEDEGMQIFTFCKLGLRRTHLKIGLVCKCQI